MALAYRKEIDGLRAWAVIPVLLFHAGIPGAETGYLGVDVFFVISGYLITRIIIQAIEQQKFKLTDFYVRRMKRIAPALLTVIFFCIPLSWYTLVPNAMIDFSQSVLSSIFFISNFHFWLETGYFETAASSKPLLHTWSLSVEEQYYLLIPSCMVLVAKWKKEYMLHFFIIVGAVSFILSYGASMQAPNANFFLPFTRMWQIMIGAICAHIHIRYGLRSNDGLSIIGLLGLIISFFYLHTNTVSILPISFWPTISTGLILLYASQHNITGRILSQKIFVGIGLISYSVYLWHQPLFVFMHKFVFAPTIWHVLGAFVLTFGLAWCSWKWIEQPFRQSKTKFFTLPKLTWVGLIAIVFGIGGVLTTGYTQRGALDPYQISLKKRIYTGLGTCDAITDVPIKCLTDRVPDTLVWGDSMAMHLIQGIQTSRSNTKMVQRTKISCAPIPGIALIGNALGRSHAKKCLDFNHSVMQWLEKNKHQIQTVILSSDYILLTSPQKKLSYITNKSVNVQTQKDIQRYFESTLLTLQAWGIKPIIVGAMPQNGRNIGDCLAKRNFFNRSLEACDFPTSSRTTHNVKTSQYLAKLRNRFTVIDLAKALCKNEICKMSSPNKYLYRDQKHLTKEGSAIMGKKVDFSAYF